jgi:hypothetical protein
MYDEVSSSNPPNLPMPVEGEYVWHLEVIVVVVVIDPVSREYETGPVADSASRKKKKKRKQRSKHPRRKRIKTRKSQRQIVAIAMINTRRKKYPTL